MEEIRQSPVWLKVLATVWMIWIFIDYWFKHPLYAKSIGSTYAGIPVIHLIVGGAIFYAIINTKSRGFSVLTIILSFFAFLWSGTLVNLVMYSSVDYTFGSIFGYLGRSILFVFVVIWIIWSSYYAGHLLLKRLVLPRVQLAFSVYLAMGLCLMIIFIFLTLVLGIFNSWVLIGLLAIPMALNYKELLSDIPSLVQPLDALNNLSYVAIGAVLLMVLMNAITFGHTLTPFPVGFDALNYYINLPKLIAESGHLLKGFQPYNWSLLQAAGARLTGHIEMALILSWMGLILVQWASFELGRKVMRLPSEIALVGVLLFTFMPSVTTQASQELKVDLGLTFMLLAMVLSGFSLLAQIKASDYKAAIVLAAILGLLGGIALGIKLTAVITLFAIVAILWYANLGKYAFFGIFFICLSVVFLAQLDTKAGLRVYHSSVTWLQYVSLIFGIGLLAFASLKNKKMALKTSILTAVMAISSAVIFSPWIMKNYSEIETPTFMELLNGTSHGPQINMKIIDKNLNKNK